MAAAVAIETPLWLFGGEPLHAYRFSADFGNGWAVGSDEQLAARLVSQPEGTIAETADGAAWLVTVHHHLRREVQATHPLSGLVLGSLLHHATRPGSEIAIAGSPHRHTLRQSRPRRRWSLHVPHHGTVLTITSANADEYELELSPHAGRLPALWVTFSLCVWEAVHESHHWRT